MGRGGEGGGESYGNVSREGLDQVIRSNEGVKQSSEPLDNNKDVGNTKLHRKDQGWIAKKIRE